MQELKLSPKNVLLQGFREHRSQFPCLQNSYTKNRVDLLRMCDALPAIFDHYVHCLINSAQDKLLPSQVKRFLTAVRTTCVTRDHSCRL